MITWLVRSSLILAMMHQFDVWNVYLLGRRLILSNRGSVLLQNYQTLFELFCGGKRDCFSRKGYTTSCAYWKSNHGGHDLLICVSQAIAHKREVNALKHNTWSVFLCSLGNSTNNFSLKTILKLQKLCTTTSSTIFFSKKLSIPGIVVAKKWPLSFRLETV